MLLLFSNNKWTKRSVHSSIHVVCSTGDTTVYKAVNKTNYFYFEVTILFFAMIPNDYFYLCALADIIIFPLSMCS